MRKVWNDTKEYGVPDVGHYIDGRKIVAVHWVWVSPRWWRDGGWKVELELGEEL